jgi:inner membrane protein YidH
MSEDRADEAKAASHDGRPVRPDGGRDPDYRMSLAAERTYLAYLRTGLAMTAAGVAVAAALPQAHALGLRRVLGAGLVIAGGAVFIAARPRWAAVARAMERGEPLPRSPLTTGLAIALAVAAVGALIVVLLA